MTNLVKKYDYIAFGLKISSEYKLPELTPSNGIVESTDIVIEQSDLSNLRNEFEELSKSKNKFVIKKDFVLFQIPNIATFLIQEGKSIKISPMFGADMDIIKLYILGTCMGAILMQRRVLPLHGSLVEINGKAYAFIGDSGAGKSTLALAFINKGYNLLSDDLIAVSFSNENLPLVCPAYPQQKLWQESLIEFGMEFSQYHPLVERETKYAVPVYSQFSTQTLPLSGIFELEIGEESEITLTTQEGLQRFNTLYNHTYRNFMVSNLGLMDWHFVATGNVMKKVEMFKIIRPKEGFTANNIVSLIESSIKKEEIMC